jgi:hypothetical protein
VESCEQYLKAKTEATANGSVKKPFIMERQVAR